MPDEKVHATALQRVFDQLLQHFGSCSSPNPDIDNPHKPHAIHYAYLQRHLRLAHISVISSPLNLINDLTLQVVESVAESANESGIVFAAVKFDTALMVPFETALTLHHVSLGFAVAKTVG